MQNEKEKAEKFLTALDLLIANKANFTLVGDDGDQALLRLGKFLLSIDLSVDTLLKDFHCFNDNRNGSIEALKDSDLECIAAAGSDNPVTKTGSNCINCGYYKTANTAMCPQCRG